MPYNIQSYKNFAANPNWAPGLPTVPFNAPFPMGSQNVNTGLTNHYWRELLNNGANMVCKTKAVRTGLLILHPPDSFQSFFSSFLEMRQPCDVPVFPATIIGNLDICSMCSSPLRVTHIIHTFSNHI